MGIKIENFAFGSNAFTNGNYTMKDVIYALSAMGYKKVNFLADKPLFWPLTLDARKIRPIQKALKETGLTITGLNGFTAAGHNDSTQDNTPPGQEFGPSFGDKDPESRALKVFYTKRVIDLAVEFGATEISIGSGFVPEDVDREIAWQWMLDAIEEAAEYAAMNGVYLNIESEPRLLVSTPQDVERLMAEIPSPGLGINADIGHWFVCEEDVAYWIRRFGKQIRGADIEDIGFKNGKPHHYHLVPGEGKMPLAEIFQAFRDIGFEDRHSYTIELYSLFETPIEAARKTMTWLKNFEREME